MSESRNTGAFILSLLLHVSAAVVLLLLAHLWHKKPEEKPFVMEVVAGEGADYTATQAGDAPPRPSKPIKINIPDPPKIEITQPDPDPVPEVKPDPIKPVPVKPEPIKPQPKPDPQPKAQDKPPEKSTTPSVVDYREFVKNNPTTNRPVKNTKPGPPVTVKNISAPDLATGTQAGAGGTAQTAQADVDLMTRYFATLKAQLKRNHVLPPGVGTQYVTKVSFLVSAAGDISQVKIIQSSGNADFDQSVLDTFRRTSSIGRRPDGKTDTQTISFRIND